MDYILLHGLGQTAAQWKATAEKIRAGQKVCCPELSAWLEGEDASYAGLYRALEAYCEPFTEPFCLCGLSLGGVLALHYAIEHPEKVARLVLIGAQYRMPRGLLRFQNAIFRLMPASAFRTMGLGKKQVIGLTRSMMALDFENDLPKVSCRTLVLCGEGDRANLPAARQLAARIPGASFLALPGAGHEANVDAPEKLAEILKNLS